MAQFKYTLPSGAEFQLDAPTGTTQSQADIIFYGQVAAGTFVGYKPGDTLTSPESAFTNFGLSRLDRGTAGVDDNTLLAITSGLPSVTNLPATVSTATVTNPVEVSNYILVSSDPATGLIDQGPNEIGTLSRADVQAVMAAATIQAANVLSMLGVGKYGFNGPQLIRAGYIKSEYESDFAVNPSTQANPPDFITLMNSPSVWTGKDSVISVDDILNNEALQNTIQEMLMNQSYDTLVDAGLITPPTPATTTPVASDGQVYDPTGQMLTTSPVTLRTSSSSAILTATGTVVGASAAEVANLGPTAEAQLQAGQGSLSTGAANFDGGQVSGLATGAATGAFAATAALLASRVTGDIGGLIANASKVGPALTAAWAQGTDVLSKLTTTDLGALAEKGLANLGDAATGALKNLAGSAEAQLKAAIAGPVGAAMDTLGKASQLATSLSSQMAGMVTGVESAAAFSNTVDRKTIDAAVTRVIGSAKISSPTYELPSLESLGISADIDQAKSILAQAGAQAQELGNQAVAVVGQAKGAIAQAQGAITQAQNSVNGLGKNLFG